MIAKSTIATVAAVWLAATPCTFAQDVKGKPAQKPAKADMPAMPKPAPEMAQLKLFDGSWTCTGETPAGPMGPAQKTRSTVKAHTGMGGFWQVGNVSVSFPAMEGTFHNTYDRDQKRYVMLWMDNTGGYAQQTSTGWEGDKMVFQGDGNLMGQKVQARDTFVKSADGSFKHSGEAQMGGQWVTLQDETCKKAAAGAVKK